MNASALSARTDRRLIRAVYHSHRFVLVEVTAPPATAAATRPRVNVSFVLDRSGSMGGANKFGLAAGAVRDGIERLAATDRFSVVVYDTEIDVVAPGAIASSEARRAALRALERIGPRGGTDLGGGWLRGAEQVAAALDPEAVNRVLLLTDGLANHGMTDPTELARHASELRARGVSTSTFGVGQDFDERLLGGMADTGGGAFRFIGRADEIAGAIGSEVGELLEVTARGTQLRVAGPEGIRIECLSSFPVEGRPKGAVVHVGDLVSDQVVSLVLRLGFPLGDVGRDVGVELALADRDGRLDDSTTLTWSFADGEANDRQTRDRDVDRVVARTYADRALKEAVDLNRRGQWDEARALLQGVARRVRSYAGHDEVLRGIVAELESEAENWSTVRLEMERKVMYSRTNYALKSRAPMSGAAERRPPR
jgi:Ca-activated chloride channel homolog